MFVFPVGCFAENLAIPRLVPACVYRDSYLLFGKKDHGNYFKLGGQKKMFSKNSGTRWHGIGKNHFLDSGALSMFGSSGAYGQRHTHGGSARDEGSSGTVWNPELHLIVPKCLVQPNQHTGLAFLLYHAFDLRPPSEHQGTPRVLWCNRGLL